MIPRAVVVVAVTVGATSCGGLFDGDDGLEDRFYDQELTWRKCPSDELPPAAPSAPESENESPPVHFECATVKVPLDYDKPEGKTIKLALNRISASNKDKRIGSLLTNPGGPGESGLQLVYGGADAFTPRMRERYDIIGMDPRGVGKSSPVRCQTAEEQTQTEASEPDESKQAQAFVDACKAKSSAIVPFVGTDNVARDLDVVRGALGDDKLNYLGWSYGTVLGQFYAEQFPSRVGRMVLDSVANPSTWPSDPSAQVVAFETALRVFVETCVARPDCPLGQDRAEILKQFDDLATRLESEPLPGGENTPPVSADTLLQVLSTAMYQEETWPQLETIMAATFQGDGAPLAQALAALSGTSGDPDSDATGGQDAVACLHIPPEKRTADAAAEAADEASHDAPIFGPTVASLFRECVYWPTKSLPNAGQAIRAEGAPPILLVHNLYDAATPVQWARSVEGQLADAVLVTNAAGGHGFYNKGACTKDIVDHYLLSGKLPAKGTTCHDRAPGEQLPTDTGSN